VSGVLVAARTLRAHAGVGGLRRALENGADADVAGMTLALESGADADVAGMTLALVV
jgi:hypothetical protein